MRICRFQHEGREKAGIWQEEGILDLSPHMAWSPDLLDLRSGAHEIAERLASDRSLASLSFTAGRFLPPVLPHNRIFAVAQNYPSHAREVAGAEAPSQPVVFMKPYSALVAHMEPIILPTLSEFMDYEGELAAIIGRKGRSIPAADAMNHVLGFSPFNDVSARDLQTVELGGRPIIDWFSGKSIDRTTPIGPCIALATQVADPQNLRLQLRLNGEVMQDERTSGMVFSIAELIEFVSSRVTLEPGDVISTGTPAGVGRSRGIRLTEGDTVEVEIEQVGILVNPVLAEETSEEDSQE